MNLVATSTRMIIPIMRGSNPRKRNTTKMIFVIEK